MLRVLSIGLFGYAFPRLAIVYLWPVLQANNKINSSDLAVSFLVSTIVFAYGLICLSVYQLLVSLAFHAYDAARLSPGFLAMCRHSRRSYMRWRVRRRQMRRIMVAAHRAD